MNQFKKMVKLDDERAKFKRYCKCGHSIVFAPTSRLNKIICTWCGNYIYKNDEIEFKENVKKVLK